MITQNQSGYSRCPVCWVAGAEEFIAIDDVPVFCNVLCDSRSEALAAAKGRIRLHFCPNCGHVFNADFDSDRVKYTNRYENSLQYSPVFRTYLIDLAEQLIQRYHLYKKEIVEIGCGQGDFLRLLSEKGANRCTGFEPAYDEQRSSRKETGSRFDIVRDYYSDKYSGVRADFFACRQVLEHIAEPRNFMTTIRRAIGRDDTAVVFFEVPNAMFTLEKFGIWDLIYEHCGYYTKPSLHHLFADTGLKPLSVADSFGGQYLCIEARPLLVSSERDLPESLPSIGEVAGYVHSFAEMYSQTVSYWQDSLKKMILRGIRPVVWGAGSKGVTFLNVLRTAGLIEDVVDINPYKQGRYVPGSGQQVVSPEALDETGPKVVIAMNPLYTNEIEKMIGERNRGKNEKLVVIPVDRIDSDKNAVPC